MYQCKKHFGIERIIKMKSDLSNALKNIFLGGVGAIAITAEKSKELVDQLVVKGEITIEQRKVLNEELKRELREKVNDAASVIKTKESAETISEYIDQMSPEEIQLLRDKLDALKEQNIEQIFETPLEGEGCEDKIPN
jgi:polyhydroxyalkanoate synthesis regulator phasin